MKHRQQSLISSFACAFRGMIDTVITQRNAKIQIVAAIFAIIIGFIVELSAIEWCLIIILIAAVLAAEAVNTAIENTIDIVTRAHDERARLAKDAAAGAVLFLAIAAAICGLIIFTLAFLRNFPTGA